MQMSLRRTTAIMPYFRSSVPIWKPSARLPPMLLSSIVPHGSPDLPGAAAASLTRMSFSLSPSPGSIMPVMRSFGAAGVPPGRPPAAVPTVVKSTASAVDTEATARTKARILQPAKVLATTSPAGRAEGLADHLREVGLAERLAEQEDCGVDPALVAQHVVGV